MKRNLSVEPMVRLDKRQDTATHRVAVRKGVTILSMDGSLGYLGMKGAEESFAGLPERACLKIVLDLSDVEQIDSSGVGGVITLHKAVRSRGGRLVVACLQPQPSQLIRRLGLESAFQMFDNLDEAVFELARQTAA